MSDYISNIENYVHLYRSVNRNRKIVPNEWFLNRSNVNSLGSNEHVGGDGCRQNITTTDRIKENEYLERVGCGNIGCTYLDVMDVSDIRQLERLSANLIQLLQEAKHRSTMVANDHLLFKMGRHQAPREHIFSSERVHGNFNCMPTRRQYTSAPHNNDNVVNSVCSSHNTLRQNTAHKVGPGYSDLSSCSSFDESEKNRHKADKHNKMRKKKLSFVNNRQSEFRSLSNEKDECSSAKQKGSVLKESIDCIKSLKMDRERIKMLRDRLDDTDRELRSLTQRVEQLESRSAIFFTNNDRCEYQESNGNNAALSTLTSTDNNNNNNNRNVQGYRLDCSPSVSETNSFNDAFEYLSPDSIDSITSANDSSRMEIDEMKLYF